MNDSVSSRSTRTKKARKRKRRVLLTVNLILAVLILTGGALIFAREHAKSEARTAAALKAAYAQQQAAPAPSADDIAESPKPSDEVTSSDELESAATDAAEDPAIGSVAADLPEPSGEEAASDNGASADKVAETEPPSGDAADSASENPPAAASPSGTASSSETENSEPEAKPADSPKKSASKDNASSSSGGSSATVNLTFAGDVIFSGKVQSLLDQEGYDYPYTYVKDRFKNDDLTVINLETPVTSMNTTGASKSFVFKSSPKALAPLKQSGVDVVNLANNHTLDQGIPGLLDTIKNLDAAGIKHVGAGKDASTAYAPVYVERKGVKIAIVGVSRVLPETHWAAGDNHPGAASAYDPQAAAHAVAEARKNADVVVAIAHWGKERVDMPDENQKTLAHAMIDAGADLIIGGHAHVLQGFEQYKGKWIAYGTGNFIFTKSATAKTWETGVFQAECTKDGDCSMKLVPYWAEVGRPVPMEQPDAQKLLKRIETLSPGVKIDAKGNIRAN
ncbi:CapA family protein [Saccharibacillus sp. JS10]|uniref:CapA family protein n=1 Tax=Saccharibacillus sp. JS10 TaxID=2950552 RepID=UPI00210BCBF2|nr:CapA family protein [Saccharibacillus sp. JS10]MCQ4086984.1 CapA family protein [Saccharibacillus sp. JS10]